jgi:hypothetical protein
MAWTAKRGDYHILGTIRLENRRNRSSPAQGNSNAFDDLPLTIRCHDDRDGIESLWINMPNLAVRTKSTSVVNLLERIG